MLKTLIKKQLLELFSGYVIDRKTGKARSKKAIILYALLYVAVFFCVGFAIFGMAGGLGGAILGHGFNWLYFALMGLLAIALGLFGSVFNTYASLYLPKDNEFLLSLPIPGRTLVLARTAGVYLMSLLYSALVWVPAMIAYWIIVPVTARGILCPLLLTFVIALFVSVLSCVLGWVVALIATKAKGKSFLTVFLSLFVIVAYYVVYFKIVNSLGEIVSHLDAIGSRVKTWLHYVYLLGTAADGNLLSLAGIAAITLLLAAVCWLVLSKTFLKFALTAEKAEKSVKKPVEYEKNSVKKALLRRELKHFTSLSVWMLNGGLGLLVLPVAAIAAIIKRDAIGMLVSGTLPVPTSLLNALPVFLFAAIGLIVSMNLMLPCSVSLEGKTMWILQTLPVGAREILHAKERMGVILNLGPALFAALVLGFVCQLEVTQILLLLCALWLYIWIIQDFGLFLNLRHPDFNWTNPVTVVKQSMPVFFALFGGWIFCVLIALGGYFLCRAAGIYTAMAAIIVLLAVLRRLLLRWLDTKGVEIFQTL